jgi:hypothetical protein
MNRFNERCGRRSGCNGGAEHDAPRRAHPGQLRAGLAASTPGRLSASERDDLLLMREEEKIARDVYMRLYSRWGLRPFGNIAGSEQAHMDAMLSLLRHHGLPDPVKGMEVGKFAAPEMQSLHDRLLQQGLQTEVEALRVGLRIEELDIADLRAAAARTQNPEILAVYADLERGSRNHLRAFYRWLQRMNARYEPVHLDREEFEFIALSQNERCH